MKGPKEYRKARKKTLNIVWQYEKLVDKLKIAELEVIKNQNIDKLNVKWLNQQIQKFEEQYPEVCI